MPLYEVYKRGTIKYDIIPAIYKALDSLKVQRAIGDKEIEKIIVARNVINIVTKEK